MVTYHVTVCKCFRKDGVLLEERLGITDFEMPIKLPNVFSPDVNEPK